MRNAPDGRTEREQARRHFLGLAAATSARLGAAGAIAMMHLPTAAQAKGGNGKSNGVGWGVGGTPPGRGGGPNCFLKGTLISTDRGELPIQQLRIGDLVKTARGPLMPIKWIGRRRFERSGANWPESVAPILVRASALDDEIPRRDLYLSPTHRLLINGAFIEVRDLVNGVSVCAAPPQSRILQYYHLLLETHEAVFAEGAAAATLQLASRNHEGFDNFIELDRLYGAGLPTQLPPYAPTLGSGGKEHLKALLRLSVSPMFRMRDPLRHTFERLARRGELLGL